MSTILIRRREQPRVSGTVAQFAAELKKSPETLLEQLHSAGVEKASPHDALSDSDKQRLLEYLQRQHGAGTPERKRITLVKCPKSAARSNTAKRADKILLVGNLGGLAFVGNNDMESALRSAYRELSQAFGLGARVQGSRDDGASVSVRGAWGQLNRALRKLRTCKSLQRIEFNPLAGVGRRRPSIARTCAFFHEAKVDGRNLP